MVSQHALQVVSQHVLQVSSGVYPSMPCRFPGPQPGGSLRGLAGGVSRPTPRGELEESGQGGLQAHTWGVCIPACTEAETPPPHTHSRRLLLRAVRILLECILVRLVLGFVRATETFRENVGGGCRDRRERLSISRPDGALYRL